MRINTPKLTNIAASDEVTEYLMKKLGRVEKLMRDDESALLDVELAKTSEHHQSGDIFRSEFNLMTTGSMYRAEHTAPDLKSAIDLAVDELIESIRSSKHKRTHIVRRGGLKIKNMIKGISEWRARRRG